MALFFEFIVRLCGMSHDHYMLSLPSLALILLLLWRLWNFTVRPLLYPTEPRELPYWIPYFGHVRSFFKDYNGALEDARKYFKDSKEPYTITIAGTRIYVLTSPTDVANCYRNTTTIVYHNIVVDMYKGARISQDGIDKLFTPNPSTGQMPAYQIIDYVRLQAHPGENFDDLLHDRIIPGIDRNLCFDNTPVHPAVLETSKDGVTVSLLDLCNELFVRGTIEAFLGAAILKVNPHLLKAFRQWERTNWKYMFQMPDFMSKDMATARDEIIDTFLKYFRIPPEEREDSSYFMKISEELARGVGFSEQDMARIFMLHFWAILGNMYKVAFWAIAYLAYDASLFDAIRAEVSPAIKDGKLDEQYLAEKCPKLNSLITETLRLTVASAVMREIVAPTPVGGKVLQPGSKLLVPYRQLHYNRDIWGSDPSLIEPFRFETNAKLENSKSYRPFGGGNNLCPGRFVAKRSLGYTIALLVSRFDVSVDRERTQNGAKTTDMSVPAFPRIDTTKPSPGASLPRMGDDVSLFLRRSTGSL